jgi:hypothetical protein
MKSLIKTIWWLLLAGAPYALHRIESKLLHEIGCAPRGDCYERGTMAAFDLHLLAIAAAGLIWPVCFWYLVGRHLVPKKRAAASSSVAPAKALDLDK